MKAASIALTWDGARWPTKKLPLKARAFLKIKTAVPAASDLAGLFEDNQISELRICWVPKLAGGSDVLTSPFASCDGKRVAFHAAKVVPLGEMLGVVYRRADPDDVEIAALD